MNICQVIKILNEPEECKLRLDDDVTVDYWSVAVVMQHDNYRFNSFVTFDSLEKAIKLKLGDEFIR